MANNKIVTGDRLEYFKNKLSNVAISNDYNDLDNKLTAGENITISDTNVISASGGSVVVDDALSMTSENPVQNKVITSKIATVLGVPINPEFETHNYNFANPIPFHTPASNQKMINAFFFDNVDNKYYYIEFIYEIQNSQLSYLPLIDFKFVKDANGKITVASKYNGVQRVGPQCDVIVYIYDDTGTLVRQKGPGYLQQRYSELTWSILLTDTSFYFGSKNLTKGNPIDSTFITSDEISDAQNVPLFNYTINGEIPKTPWEQINEKVNALENTPIATTSVAGKVIPDGTSITVDSRGVISAIASGGDNVFRVTAETLSADLIDAFESGKLCYLKDTINTVNYIYICTRRNSSEFRFHSVNDLTEIRKITVSTSSTVVSIGNATSRTLADISYKATSSHLGLVKPDGTSITVNSDGVISFNDEIKSETFNLTDINGHGGEGTITVYQWYKFCWSEITITKASSSRFVATGSCANISVPSGKMFVLSKDTQDGNINGTIVSADGATQISLVITEVTNPITLATDVAGLIRYS